MEAGRDIDDVLRIQRRRLERTVALGRLAGLGTAAFLSTAVQFTREADGRTWIPGLIFGTGTVYAVVILLLLRRRDLGLVPALLAITGDLVVMTAVYPIAQRVSPELSEGPLDNVAWPAFICGVTVMLVVFINSLRASRATSAYLAVVGPAAFLVSSSLIVGVRWWEEDWAPAVFSSASVIFVASLLSIYSAGEYRRFLERYARYELLKRWLPTEAVRRVLADDRPLTLGGRKLPLTLVATDLRGFTSLSEGLSPEQLLEQLNEYHGAMLECVERNGGMLDKFMGDGALSIFGVRADEGVVEDAGAQAAIACARDMLEALATLNEARVARGLPALAMGIGVHTGEVVLGNIGAPGRRLELTVIGDAANTASRLESATKELGVPLVVSDATLRRIPEALATSLRPLGDVSVRGRKEPVTVYTFADPDARLHPLQA